MKSVISLFILVAALFGCTTLSPVVDLQQPEALRGEVTQAGVVVLTVFGAEWCQFCKDFDAKIPDLQEKYGEDLKIVMVNADKWPPEAFGIPAEVIPFFVISLDGKTVEAGNGTYDDVVKSIDEAVALLKNDVKPLPKGGTP